MSLRDKYTDEEWTELENRLAFHPKRGHIAYVNTAVEYEQVEILSDGEGHEYVVPTKNKLREKFYELLEDGNEEEFNDIFDEYQCSGDPFNEYEFYIVKK